MLRVGVNAIETEHLSKRYLLGRGQATTLREALHARGTRPAPRAVLSLDDVTLQVPEGEAGQDHPRSSRHGKSRNTEDTEIPQRAQRKDNCCEGRDPVPACM